MLAKVEKILGDRVSIEIALMGYYEDSRIEWYISTVSRTPHDHLDQGSRPRLDRVNFWSFSPPGVEGGYRLLRRFRARKEDRRVVDHWVVASTKRQGLGE